MSSTGQLQPPVPSDVVQEAEQVAMPVASYLCQWKVPKKGKYQTFKCQQLCFRSMIVISTKREELASQKILTLDQQYYMTMLSLLPALLKRVQDESLRGTVSAFKGES